MPEATERFEHLHILRELRSELIAAAHRQEANRHTATGVRSWLSRPMNAAVVAAMPVLAGAAIAVAATGVLNGSPVKQQGTQRPNVGIGAPSPGGSHLLALSAPDPDGGLPWGMRVVQTTRGEACVQIARLQDDQLGQLGIDGAFHDDGRFHPLAPSILPEISDSGDVSCNGTEQIRIGEWQIGDRSAAPDLPELTSFKPTATDLRSISWGLLGPHAVSITYHTAAGVRTAPVTAGTGAYLIVSAVSHVPRSIGEGGWEYLGWTSGHNVSALGPSGLGGSVMAATFRFGSFTCSIGHGAAEDTSCPTPRTSPAEHLFEPTQSLNEPVRVTLRTQSHDSCSAAFLVDPCFRAEIEFKAPYAVTSARSEYFVRAKSRCNHARASNWATRRDIQHGETVRTESTGLFNCTSDEFKVIYLHDSHLIAAGGPHEVSVIVGTADSARARRRVGAQRLGPPEDPQLGDLWVRQRAPGRVVKPHR